MTGSTLFTCLRTKDELRNALHSEPRLEMTEALLELYPRGADIRSKLKHLEAHTVRRGIATPGKARVMSHLKLFDAITPETHAVGKEPFAEVELAGKDSIRNQTLRKIPVEPIAAMLIAAAAPSWNVIASACRPEADRVPRGFSRSASFCKFAAANQPLPNDPPLKAKSAVTLIGQSQRRIDSAEKSDSTAVFGADVVLPGRLFAGVHMCPILGGTSARFDTSAASGQPGARRVFKVGALKCGAGGVVVISGPTDHAHQAAKSMMMVQDHGAAAQTTSADILGPIVKALESDEGDVICKVGDSRTALAGAATVRVGTQAPVAAQFAFAQVLEIPMAQVDV